MPKILVIGATGYIGRALALSLVRSGCHTVYGLARTPAKARELERLEIVPVAGSATDSAAYLELIRAAHIDVVVDAAGANQEGAQIVRDVRAAGAERLRRASQLAVPLAASARLGFVYTSGQWVHGHTAADTNDLDPIDVEGAAEPPLVVKWRAGVERLVLEAADVLDVAVARPGLVYGGSSWIFDGLFGEIQEGAERDAGADLSLKANGAARVGLIHVDDAGAGLHALVDKLPLLRGTGVWPVFDFTGSVESLGALLAQAAKAFGVTGRVNFESTEGDVLGAAISTESVSSNGRARTLLGWEPKRPGMLAQMDLYVRAWRAHKAE